MIHISVTGYICLILLYSDVSYVRPSSQAQRPQHNIQHIGHCPWKRPFFLDFSCGIPAHCWKNRRRASWWKFGISSFSGPVKPVWLQLAVEPNELKKSFRILVFEFYSTAGSLSVGCWLLGELPCKTNNTTRLYTSPVDRRSTVNRRSTADRDRRSTKRLDK